MPQKDPQKRDHFDLGSWTWDNLYIPKERRENLFFELRRLITLLEQRQYSMTSPPAELEFALVKEILLHASFIFRHEHTDIMVRNPALRIVYRPSMFHGVEGQKEIDTGLPTEERFYSSKPKLRTEEFLSEYFGDILQEVIELELAYFKKRKFFFQRVNEILIDRAQTSLRRSQDPLSTSTSQEIKKWKAQAAYWRRRFYSVSSRDSGKQS